jgi:sulfatase modifying factor 1
MRAFMLLWLLGLAAGFACLTNQSASQTTVAAQEITNGIGMRLITIPAGEFDMGSAEPAAKLADSFKIDVMFFGDQYPLHHVRITRPFYLGTCEVTVGQWRDFVKDTGYRTEAEADGKGSWGYDSEKTMRKPEQRWLRKPELTWRSPGFAQADEHPVVHVSWNDAKAFCDWLSRKEKKTYRLPTEAEWEYACRAGTKSRYSTGDAPESLKGYANIADRTANRKFTDWPFTDFEDGYVFTSPIGTFKANAYGVHDMHGNVWEWCADWYDSKYYSKSPASDPVNTTPATNRVIRGGGWDYYVGGRCQSASRAAHAPSTRYDYLGFRVVAVQSGD